jgi:hypothetical protein
VIYHAHLVGLGIVHPYEGLRHVGGEHGRLHG